MNGDWLEACPDCVNDPDELIFKEGENNDLRMVMCDNCGGMRLIPHEHDENTGESEIC
jgi:hypothetical protein